MRTPLVVLLLVAAVALPASASASVTVNSAKLTPSTTQAAAHPKLTIDLAFGVSSGDDVKSIGLVLPQGLVGDPTAADKCRADKFDADQCAEGTVVGTTTATANVDLLPVLGIPQSVPGTVYNLQPKGSEPARLGVVLRPALGLPKIFLESPATIGPDTNFGLKTVFDNLPRDAGGVPIQVTAQQLVLNDKAAHGPFLTNPTGCGEAKTTVTVTSYDEPNAPKTGTSSFTPTGCDALPFAPKLSGTLGGSDDATARNKSPHASAVIAPGGAGESNVASAKVTLPPEVGPNITAIGRVCTKADFDAGTCADTSVVGSATAASPLLATPLTGPVRLIQGAPLALAVQFGPPVPLTLIGAVDITSGPPVNTFTGIPDVPLSRFELNLDGGGTNGLLVNTTDLCKVASAPTAKGTLTSQSGKTVDVTGAFEVNGCTPGPGTSGGGGEGQPRATLSLRYRRGLGTLRARFSAAKGGKRLARAQLKLPKGFVAKRAKHPRKRLRVTAGKRKLGRKAVKLRGRTLGIRLRGAGAKTVTVRWGGVKPGRSLARRLRNRRPKLTFVAKLTPKGERTRRLKLSVRPPTRAR